MATRVAVAGASGYAGGELLRLLAAHPSFDAGRRSPRPPARGSRSPRCTRTSPPSARSCSQETTPAALAEADLVFLALPHGESAALAAQLPRGLPVVDLGADFRLSDAAAWERYYGGAHAGTWAYGLPELPGARERIAGATRVADPGCYPTAVALGLAPLLAAGPGRAGRRRRGGRLRHDRGRAGASSRTCWPAR